MVQPDDKMNDNDNDREVAPLENFENLHALETNSGA